MCIIELIIYSNVLRLTKLQGELDKLNVTLKQVEKYNEEMKGEIALNRRATYAPSAFPQEPLSRFNIFRAGTRRRSWCRAWSGRSGSRTTSGRSSTPSSSTCRSSSTCEFEDFCRIEMVDCVGRYSSQLEAQQKETASAGATLEEAGPLTNSENEIPNPLHLNQRAKWT